MNRNLFAALFVLVPITLGVMVGGCASTAGSASTGPTKFVFWHSMTGVSGDAISELIKQFNASQNKCVGEVVVKDSLDDTLTQVQALLPSKQAPALVQISSLSTQILLDWQAVDPLQGYVDRDRYDLSGLEQNALGYYSLDGKLYGMPFNISAPILYYNKNAFKAAGLDPNNPPRTFSEVTQAARKLTKQGPDGKSVQYGYAMAIYGWFFEQFLAASGALYLDNGNGRDARATKAVFNSPEGVRILSWWKEGFDAGIFGNYGRATADTEKAFDTQQTAMFVDSTAVLTARLAAAQGKFELGTGFLPRPDGAPQGSGTIVGGAAVFIMNDRPVAERDCAWEFVKYFAAPERQAYWHTTSGYYPLTRAAYDVQADRDWVARYPQFLSAIDQLHASPNNHITQGALTGPMAVARQRVELAVEQALQGKRTPQASLDDAAADVNKLIADYRR